MSVHVQAHRGLSAERPENTLAAFRAAAEAGFHGIELDTRLTHDGEVVCIHDANLARTTDGAGRVAELDYDEMRRHDTGAGPVPRLVDVMRDLADAGLWWNVEVKSRDAVIPTLEVVQHRTDQASFSSLDPGILQVLRDEDPDIPLEFITLGPPDDEDIQIAAELGCRAVNVDHDFIDADLIGRLRDDGFRVGAWTVNDPERAVALAKLGVDVVMTDVRGVLEALRSA